MLPQTVCTCGQPIGQYSQLLREWMRANPNQPIKDVLVALHCAQECCTVALMTPVDLRDVYNREEDEL